MNIAHWLRLEDVVARREEWHHISCKNEHNLLQEFGGIQPHSRNFVVSSKAADAVPEAAGNVPHACHFFAAMLALSLQAQVLQLRACATLAYAATIHAVCQTCPMTTARAVRKRLLEAMIVALTTAGTLS